MKHNPFKKLYLIILIVPIFSCTQSDPLSKLGIGKISLKELYEKILKDGLADINVVNDENYDTIYTHNINGNLNLRSILWTNTDEYKYDTLYAIKLNIGTDSIQFLGNISYRPGKGNVTKEKLKSIMELYETWYGKPTFEFSNYKSVEKIYEIDSLHKKLINIKEKNVELNNRKSKLREMIRTAEVISPSNYYKVWMLKKFNLMISYSFNNSDSSYTNSYIKYESKDYKTISEKRREYIRQTAEMNDFIKIDINLDPFTKGDSEYTNRLNLTISSIFHNLPEEPRNIRNFKFDVIIKNEYLDTILVIENLEYDGIGILESAYYTGGASSPGGLLRYHVDYNQFSEDEKKYEELRKLRDRKIENGNFSDIKVLYNIKSIVFENGDVLK
jgi:hypothetical protein